MQGLARALRAHFSGERLSWFGAGVGAAGVAVIGAQLLFPPVSPPPPPSPTLFQTPTRTPFPSRTPFPTRTPYPTRTPAPTRLPTSTLVLDPVSDITVFVHAVSTASAELRCLATPGPHACG